MSSIRKYKNALIGSIFAIALLVLCSMAMAEDFSTPHTFKAGDVISSDMMNEIFDYIKHSKKSITSSDLVGTWDCTAYFAGDDINNAVNGWSQSKDGLYMFLEDVTITFSEDGDNTYTLSTSAPKPFDFKDSTSCTSKYEVVANTLYLNANNFNRVAYTLEKVSESRIICSLLFARTSDTVFSLIIDKKGLPPANPDKLSAIVSGFTVSLAWTDNSDNETGFKIMRRDSLKGSYSLIATTTSNATAYNDTVPDFGTYWYRVKATNSNGDSLGSNVVKVTVSE